MVNPEAPGTWCQWDEQISLVTVSSTVLEIHIILRREGGIESLPSCGQVNQSGERLVVPTSETLKQEFFLKLAIKHEFPLTLV